MAWFGNARHPATESVAPDPQGIGSGSNECLQTVVTNGPSAQAVALVGGLGVAVHTGSPMSRGARTWNGDQGYGVHRFSGRLAALTSPASLNPTGRAVEPVANPLRSSIRSGLGVGASQQNGYPGTGMIGDFGSSVNALDLDKLNNVGLGG